MKIGIDFDNTIACYDGLFYKAALEKGLIPHSLGTSKKSVRDYLRKIDLEEEWTKLQGEIYGERIDRATPYPGVEPFFRYCQSHGIETVVVSHKTKIPYLGPPLDLHLAAQQWLDAKPFSPGATFFEVTLEKKLKRIKTLSCDYFIDDLPELFAEPLFPSGVKKILFDPKNHHLDVPNVIHTSSWEAILEVIQ